MSSRATILAAVAVASFCPAGALWSQERPNGFYFTSPLSLSAGADRGFIADSRKVDDTVGLLSLQPLAWLRSTHRTKLSVDYQPEFELFSRNPSMNAWNHAATFRMTHQINSRFSAVAGNAFLSTMDPTRRLVNSLLLLPRGRFLQNSFYAGLGYRYNALTKLIFRFDNAITTMDLARPLKGRLDQATAAGTVTLDRTVTTRQSISANYSFLRVHPFEPAIAGAPVNVNIATLGYTFEVSPRLVLRLAGGAVRGSEFSFTGSAAIEKKLGGLWVAAGYQRYLPFGNASLAGSFAPGSISFTEGLTPASVYQVGTLRAWGNLTRRVGIELMAQRAFNGVDPQYRDVRSRLGQLRVDYRVNDRVVFFTRLEYYGQNINQFFDSSMSRRRFFGGIEIALFRGPETPSPRAPQQPEEPLAHEDRTPEAKYQ